MKLFSLTQTLYGFYHEREDDHWVRKRNGRTLHPGDRYHPDTYRTPRFRPQHMHYEADDRDIEEFYAPRGQRGRPTSPAPLILRREPRGHGWEDIEEPSYERPASPAPLILCREPRGYGWQDIEEPSYERPNRRPPHVDLPRPRKASFDEHQSFREERERQTVVHRVRSTHRSPSPRPSSPHLRYARRGRALSPSPTPLSRASTLVPSMYEPDDRDHVRETHYRYRPERPRQDRQEVRFAPRPEFINPRHTESVNPLITTIQVNHYHHDARDALARLEALARRVYPAMHKFHLRVGNLRELDEFSTAADSFNSGHGQEISVKVRRRDGGWRSMDEMVDSLLGDLAHNVYSGRGREWYELRERLRREVGRLRY